MVLRIRARRGQCRRPSARFQLVHETASGGEGVNASVSEQRKRGEIHSGSLALDKHPSI